MASSSRTTTATHPTMSTFIVECEAATWHRAGLDRMSDAEIACVLRAGVRARPRWPPAHLQQVDLAQLSAALQLASGPRATRVLIGDALRTGHFSIGSGTRLAFEDAIALDRALGEAGRRRAGGAGRVRAQAPAGGGEASCGCEPELVLVRAHAEKMALEPWQLAYDYMTRSGRMADERLRARRRGSWQRGDRERVAIGAPTRRSAMADPVRRAHAPGAAEIGFDVPERYNARRILFDNLAAGRAEKTAVVCGRAARTRTRELCALAARVGNGLARDGSRARRPRAAADARHARVCRGDLRRDPRGLRAGAHQYTVARRSWSAYYLQDSGAEAAIVHDALRRASGAPTSRASRLRHVVVVGDGAVPPARAALAPTRWDAWITAPAPDSTEAETHRDEMAFWMYSSGSDRAAEGCRPPAARRALHVRVATAGGARHPRATTSCSRRRRSSSPTGSATR